MYISHNYSRHFAVNTEKKERERCISKQSERERDIYSLFVVGLPGAFFSNPDKSPLLLL